MRDTYSPLVEGYYYHIYNRGNNKGNIFYIPQNYEYFLRKYDQYLSAYLETYAYCLLPNHFHLLVMVKENLGVDAIAQSDGIGKTISEQFRRFFITYSQAINKQEGRTGSLFEKNFKRLPIKSERYLIYLVYYIHYNPQRHSIIDDYRKYPHSSFQRILLNKPSKLQKQKVLEWFGSKDEYIKFHSIIQNLSEIEDMIIEDN